jgi:hypothetical protein
LNPASLQEQLAWLLAEATQESPRQQWAQQPLAQVFLREQPKTLQQPRRLSERESLLKYLLWKAFSRPSRLTSRAEMAAHRLARCSLPA